VPEHVVRRLPPQQRRELILAGALTAIRTRGVTAVTVRDIAATAGVSVGTVTHHFSGIEEILTEVLRTVRDETRERVAATLAERESALDGLGRFVGVLLADDLATRGSWSVWLAAGARAAYDPGRAQYFAERGEAWRVVIRDLLLAGEQAGEFQVVDAEAMTTEILALVDGYGLQAFFGNGRPSPGEARAQARAAVRDRLARGNS
jgi:AcrR family transcriptional regulator